GGEPQDSEDQLCTYLAIAARAEGAPGGCAYPIIVSTDEARLGRPTVMDAIEIGGELENLTTELLEDVAAAQPNPGPWCATRYCKARAACPATAQAIERALPAEMLLRKP